MRAAVITGVSRGLGGALFDELIDDGARVFAVGRSFTPEQTLLAERDPKHVTLRRADLTHIEELPSADELYDFLAGANEAALILNAAAIFPIGAIGLLPHGELAYALHVNLLAPMALTDIFVSAIEAVGPDRITVSFISSGAARHAIDGLATYCTTKTGAEMFFQALASQMRNDKRWRVHCLDPGTMATGMVEDMCNMPGDVYFPRRAYYIGLLRRGALPTPRQAARRLLDYLFT